MIADVGKYYSKLFYRCRNCVRHLQYNGFNFFHQSSYHLNDLSNFNKIFRKDVTYDNIKSHKKQGFTLSLEDIFLEKPQREGSQFCTTHLIKGKVLNEF